MQPGREVKRRGCIWLISQMENWSRRFWYIKPHRHLILLRSSESYRSKWFGYNRYVLLHQLDLCFPGQSGISWGLGPSFLPLSLWLQSCANRWLKAEKLHHHRKAGSGSQYGSALLCGVGNWTSPLLTCAELLTSVAQPLKPSPRAYRAHPTWYTGHRQLAAFPALGLRQDSSQSGVGAYPPCRDKLPR